MHPTLTPTTDDDVTVFTLPGTTGLETVPTRAAGITDHLSNVSSKGEH